ncbi:MAG: hypothetical protein JWP19_283 [Rhodoglobus sp.]|nr:hypothetical protein [Rhodoglobus sp.]
MNDLAAELHTTERMLPQPDTVSAEFWDGLAVGELRLQRCTDCDTAQFYPRPTCSTCGGAVEWFVATGRGEVHTFTVVRANGVEPFASLVPYVFAVVQLEEGPRMLTNVIQCDPESVRIGTHVQLTPVAAGELVLPFFTPASRE